MRRFLIVSRKAAEPDFAAMSAAVENVCEREAVGTCGLKG